MGPGNAPASSLRAATVCGPTASGAAPPPVSVARIPRPPALNASVGPLAGAPVGATGGDQGGAAVALAPVAVASAAAAIATAVARGRTERCMSGVQRKRRGRRRAARRSGRQVELLAD